MAQTAKQSHRQLKHLETTGEGRERCRNVSNHSTVVSQTKKFSNIHNNLSIHKTTLITCKNMIIYISILYCFVCSQMLIRISLAFTSFPGN